MVNTGAEIKVEGLMSVSGSNKMLLVGTEHGQPDLFFLFADSLPELTRKCQNLNLKVYDRVLYVPRVLVDVSRVAT